MKQSDKIKEFLAILDKTKDEQIQWCDCNCDYDERNESLADLAFRMKYHFLESYCDAKKRFTDAIELIGSHIIEYSPIGKDTIYDWFVFQSQPIHWIVASLVAKEIADGTK